ncbi:MAG: alkaline phosphatase D family protein [Myxococcales bacterium]|nr:alkaline phosphatase D family protein [Myxococcales bacterium]
MGHRSRPRIHRRTFLRWSAGAAATIPLFGCADDEALWAPRFRALPEDPSRFPLGVHAGAVAADGARLWTHAPAGGPLVLRVWPDAAPDDVLPALEVDVQPSQAGYAAPRITGLPAGEWWRYAFFDDSAQVRSAYGRFRSAFGPGQTGVVRVGATACTNFGRRPFPALARTAAAGIDVFCHLGDLNYNDDQFTLADYRRGYAENLDTADFRAVLGNAGSYFVWDDHEFFDNEGLYAPDVDVARVAAGKQAWFECLAVEGRDVPEAGALGGNRVMWGSYRWGDAAEFFLLDSRLERDEAAGRYVSRAQLDWLKQALADSPAHFKILLNSVPIADLPLIWGPGDRWTAFPEQRAELLDHMVTAQVGNVVFLAGDFHVGAVWRVAERGPHSAMWEILCGPGGSAPSKRLELAARSDAIHDQFFPPGRIEHASGDHASTIIDFDAPADEIRVRFERASDGALQYAATLRCQEVEG